MTHDQIREIETSMLQPALGTITVTDFAGRQREMTVTEIHYNADGSETWSLRAIDENDVEHDVAIPLI